LSQAYQSCTSTPPRIIQENRTPRCRFITPLPLPPHLSIHCSNRVHLAMKSENEPRAASRTPLLRLRHDKGVLVRDQAHKRPGHTLRGATRTGQGRKGGGLARVQIQSCARKQPTRIETNTSLEKKGREGEKSGMRKKSAFKRLRAARLHRLTPGPYPFFQEVDEYYVACSLRRWGPLTTATTGRYGMRPSSSQRLKVVRVCRQSFRPASSHAFAFCRGRRHLCPDAQLCQVSYMWRVIRQPQTHHRVP